MSTSLNERDRWLAAEFAIGVLTDELRAEAAKRYDQEISFRQEVDQWAERISPMLEDVPQIAPPAHVWKNIETALSSDNSRSTNWLTSLFDNKPYGAFSAILAVLVLVVGIGYLPQMLSPNLPYLTATLSGENTPTAMIASYDRQTGMLVVTTKMQAASGHDHELWVITEKDAAPISMGIVSPVGTTEMNMPENIKGLLQEGVTLAISVEPDGGSPTGLPTGPVIAIGTLVVG